jgi:hypothetical protein
MAIFESYSLVRLGFNIYTDERKADGSATYIDIDGEAHGRLYMQLAEGPLHGQWRQTFVKGVG